MHRILQARIMEWVAVPFSKGSSQPRDKTQVSSPGDLLNPGIEPRSPALQVDSLPSEPPGKPKNTGVGKPIPSSRGSSPTRGLNLGLPHCRRILYQLNHQGSPRILEWVTVPFSGDLPNPGMELRSPKLQADSLPAEPPGKPKNTGVGNLSLLQQIFPTQESNWGLLHRRQILYQLSYQGSLC